MPLIFGLNIPPASCFILYLHGLAALIFVWWMPICAIYYRTRLEGDRSLLGLAQKYIYNSFTFSGIYFKAAYTNRIEQKRMTAYGQMAGAVIMLVIAYWELIWGKKGKEKKAENSGARFSLMEIGWGLFFDGVFMGVVMEAEERWERVKLRRREEEEQRKRQLAIKKQAEISAFFPPEELRELERNGDAEKEKAD